MIVGVRGGAMRFLKDAYLFVLRTFLDVFLSRINKEILSYGHKKGQQIKFSFLTSQ